MPAVQQKAVEIRSNYWLAVGSGDVDPFVHEHGKMQKSFGCRGGQASIGEDVFLFNAKKDSQQRALWKSRTARARERWIAASAGGRGDGGRNGIVLQRLNF